MVQIRGWMLNKSNHKIDKIYLSKCVKMFSHLYNLGLNLMKVQSEFELSLGKELSLFNKLKFSNPNIFVT